MRPNEAGVEVGDDRLRDRHFLSVGTDQGRFAEPETFPRGSGQGLFGQQSVDPGRMKIRDHNVGEVFIITTANQLSPRPVDVKHVAIRSGTADKIGCGFENRGQSRLPCQSLTACRDVGLRPGHAMGFAVPAMKSGTA